MKYWIALFSALFVTGCGEWSPFIRSEMTDDQTVIENQTDALLLVNTIEARDRAPLHFIEVPKVNGSIQANAQIQSAIPFFIKGSGLVNGSVTPQMSIQSNPSFEIDALDSKEFFTGITSSVDPKIVKYLIDRQLDSRLLMLLLVSSISVEGGDSTNRGEPASITIANTPRETADLILQCRKSLSPEDAIKECHSRTNFEIFLKIVNAMGPKGITANLYEEKTKVARSIPLSGDDISDFNPTQYKLKPVKTADRQTTKSASATIPHRTQPRSARSAKNADLAGSTRRFDVYLADTTQKVAICFNGKGPRSSARDEGSGGDSGSAKPDLCMPDSEAVDDQTAAGDDQTHKHKIQLSDFGDQEPCPGPFQAADPSTEYCKFVKRFLEAENKANRIRECPVELMGDDCPKDRGAHPHLLGTEEKSKQIAEALSGYAISFNVRSVLEIVRYLGDILYYQDALRASDKSHNIPVTLGFYPCDPKTPADECIQRNDGYFFRTNEPDVPFRFSITYRGERYSVGEYQVVDATSDAPPSARDHTLEVLSILNFLMSINKSASDIKTTPLVQVVP